MVRIFWWIWLCVLAAHAQSNDVSNITRQEHGDTFSLRGGECIKRECGGRSESLSCSCTCPVHAPLFREDKAECVDDVTECSIAPFGFGASTQRVPFVFLPLKGQIIHPSKEISFPGVRTPICAVSGAQFLTRNGFVDLRNTLDSDVPFSLFRDEGRTFLQWTGEADVRTKMEGRLLVVHLLCRDVGVIGNTGPRGLHGVFTPCAAFRVAGSPIKHVANVSEVLFSPDAHSSSDTTSSSLTTSEYVAIGVSSVLLGLIYVASIFLYLHIKRRRSRNDICPETPPKPKDKPLKQQLQNERDKSPTKINVGEDGVIKKNPLHGMGARFHDRDSEEFDTESGGSSPTDGDDAGEDISDDADKEISDQTTSVTVHPMIHTETKRIFHRSHRNDLCFELRDDSGFERLPEENVSIIETLDLRDDKPETVRAIGTTRRKLYFNPAYFEPHLLMAPPPAAIEFLVKIREVISIAKHKMATKRFMPSLNGIPEEETYDASFHHVGSQRSSVVSLKRENNRRRSHCSGCPGCEDQGPSFVPDVRALGACRSCSMSSGFNTKQTSIRKWLESVPSVKFNSLMSLSKETSPPRQYYDFPTTRSLYGDDTTNNFGFRKKSSSVKSEPSYTKFNFPLPSFDEMVTSNKRMDGGKTIAKISDISPIGLKQVEKSKKVSLKHHTMPDMINEALVVDKSIRKKLPAINDDEKHEAAIESLDNIISKKHFDYETDSLERSICNKGRSTPTEYGDVSSSSQPSPSLSTALPMDETLTMRNAVYKTNSRPNSSHSVKDMLKPKADDYEFVDKNCFDNHTYDLTELGRGRPPPPPPPNDYSLVTEVYVNNGYSFSSSPTSDSECSTYGKQKTKTTINGPEELPGHLTIEVKDPPENYIKIHESDGFEPDTLDRKPNKIKISISSPPSIDRSFKLGALPATGLVRNSTFTHIEEEPRSGDFKSLQDAYESKSKIYAPKSVDSRDYEIIDNKDEGRILTLESRHCRRQRQSTPPSLKNHCVPIPPDVIPGDVDIRCLKPPRSLSPPPPLPPKNERGRSPSSRRAKYTDDGSHRGPSGASVHGSPSSDYEQVEHPQQQQHKGGAINFRELQTPRAGRRGRNNFPRRSARKRPPHQHREDSGYLSTDTEDSAGDAHSESGAESIETHSVFFGTLTKRTNQIALQGQS